MKNLFLRKELNRKKIRKRKKKAIKKIKRIKTKKMIKIFKLKKIRYQTLSNLVFQKKKKNQLKLDYFID